MNGVDPPYVRIAAELRRRIATGELGAGDRLPSARQITQEWGVAIATATKVLATLRRAGLARPVPGVGTVVAAPSKVDSPRRRAVEQRPSREAVVRTAISIADAEGLTALSMRRVAAEFGLPTMSLYRYVSGKDELLLLMADTVYGEFPLPDVISDWRTAVETHARLQWAACRRHPWIARLVSFTRPQLAPNGMAYTEWALRALHAAGLDTAVALYVVVAVAGFVNGTAANLESELDAQQDTGVTSDEWMQAQEPAFLEIVASGRFPLLAEVSARPDFDVELDVIFELGLTLLLDGLTGFVAAQVGPTRAGSIAVPGSRA
jgi:DNA-binding transcriptional regulator YhcF (GntR family)